MDSLILTFNQRQMATYKELLQKENIDLNFDTMLQETNTFFVCDFDMVLSNMEKEAKILLNLNKHNSSFSIFFTQEEIKELIPIYYNAIREINRNSNIISGESRKLSLKLGKTDKALANMHKKYADFLPYKAALYSREDYALKIDEIDVQFKKNIELLENLKNELLELLLNAEKISNIVNDFIQKSSKATDEPKFKNFDANEFFWSIEAFIEQIKNT